METLAATSDGKVWAWGYDGDGYLGVGPVGGYRTNKPMRVIAGDADHLAAKKTQLFKC